MLGRPQTHSRWFRRPVATVLGVAVAAGAFAVLFPWFPGGVHLDEGDTAPWSLTAPRDLSFESEVRTDAVREAAARA